MCVGMLPLLDEPVTEGAAMGAEEQETAHLGRQEGASTSQPGLCCCCCRCCVRVMKTPFCEAAV